MTEKVVLGDIISGYNLSLINENFQKIEDELNNNVLYRDAPEGAPNQLEVDIDANGKRIYNLPKPISMNEPVRVFDLLNTSDVVPVTEWFVDKFVGDGSTTVFTLTHETQSDGSVFVYFDGLAKTLDTDYTVNPNEVVFTEAPAVGVDVVVHYGIFIGTGAGVTSVGTGASIVKDGDGVLRSLQGIGEVSVNVNGDVVEINTNAQNNIGVSLGTGSSVYAGKTGSTLQFKSLKAGTNVTLTESADSITVAATGAGGGEANTASNVGTGSGVFKAKDGIDLKFKSLKAGANVTLTPSADEILIEASGSGGSNSFADISAYGAVGDFVPAANGTGSGTSNDTAVMAAIATGKPLWIPAGNFYVANWPTRYAISRATILGPGHLYGDTSRGKAILGKTVFVGSTDTHEISYAGGIMWAPQGSYNGTRIWNGHHNWMVMQPDAGPSQFQIYPGGKGQAITASCESTNILKAEYGTFDTSLIRVGNHVGWNGAVYKVASIISNVRITVTTFAGANPGFTTITTPRPFYMFYEYSSFTADVTGTSVAKISGDAVPYGYAGDHMYALVNGTYYSVTAGPEVAGANKITLAASAGTLSGATVEFFRTYGPWSYVTLFRLQGVAGSVETNGGMALNIKNELRIWNGGTSNDLFGPIKLNAPKVAIGPGDGASTSGERFEVETDGVWLGSSSANASSINGIKVYGGALGFIPVVAARGAESDKGLGFDIPGTGKFGFTAGTFGRTVFEIYSPAGTNSWLTTTPGVGKATLSSNGPSNNADLEITPGGTGKLTFKRRPFCSLTRAGAMTFTNNSGTTILWDTEVSDIFGMHAPGASTVTAPVTGLYRINSSYQISATSDANGVIVTGMYLLKNGAAVKAAPIARHRGPNTSVFVCGGQFNGTVELTAGDTVEMQGYYGGSSATASLDNSFTFTCFDIELVTAY